MPSGLPQASRDEFWDLFCVRKGDSLVLKDAHRIDKVSFCKVKKSKPTLTILTNEFLSSTNPQQIKATNDLSVVKKPIPSLVPLPVGQKNQSSSTRKESLTEQSNTNSSPNNVIMIPGKQAEITVKFSTRPELPEIGKTVTLEITTEQGFIVRANVNRKTLKKQVEKMDTFTDWIGALSGKITRKGPQWRCRTRRGWCGSF